MFHATSVIYFSIRYTVGEGIQRLAKVLDWVPDSIAQTASFSIDRQQFAGPLFGKRFGNVIAASETAYNINFDPFDGFSEGILGFGPNAGVHFSTVDLLYRSDNHGVMQRTSRGLGGHLGLQGIGKLGATLNSGFEYSAEPTAWQDGEYDYRQSYSRKFEGQLTLTADAGDRYGFTDGPCWKSTEHTITFKFRSDGQAMESRHNLPNRYLDDAPAEVDGVCLASPAVDVGALNVLRGGENSPGVDSAIPVGVGPQAADVGDGFDTTLNPPDAEGPNALNQGLSGLTARVDAAGKTHEMVRDGMIQQEQARAGRHEDVQATKTDNQQDKYFFGLHRQNTERDIQLGESQERRMTGAQTIFDPITGEYRTSVSVQVIDTAFEDTIKETLSKRTMVFSHDHKTNTYAPGQKRSERVKAKYDETTELFSKADGSAYAEWSSVAKDDVQGSTTTSHFKDMHRAMVTKTPTSLLPPFMQVFSGNKHKQMLEF